MDPKPKKQTNKDRLEGIATNELPPDLQSKLKAVRDAIDALKGGAERWGVVREFSPDGRFLGDIGELIAKLFFGVTLNVKQEHGHDAREAVVDATATDKGRSVEVKLRSRSQMIEFTEPGGVFPDIILVIYVSPITLKWGVVCNGPGAKLLANAKRSKRAKLRIGCAQLLEEDGKLAESDYRLRQIEPRKPVTR